MNLAAKEFNTMSSDFHLQSVLVIDDDRELTEMLSAYLSGMGYQVQVKMMEKKAYRRPSQGVIMT